MPRILIVTGEASGDLHGGNLAAAIKDLQPTTQLLGVGGTQMKAAGVELLPGIERVDAIGLPGPRQLVHGLRNLLRLRQFLKKEYLDAVVFIDSPGTNLRLARVAAAAGHRVVYYIAPQIWAWGANRLKLISRVVHRMIVILPFEEPIFRKAGVPCTFVGHPLLDTLEVGYDRAVVRERLGLPTTERVLGLLPGSREREVRMLLPPMMEAAKRVTESIPGLRCVMAKAKTISTDTLNRFLDRTDVPLTVVPDQPNEVMAASDVLLVASGTATLQAALIGTPMVIVYRVPTLTYEIAKRLIRVKWIGLVNLVAGRGVVPELIQEEATPDRLSQEVITILKDETVAGRMREEFEAIRGQLGESGASRRAAEVVLAECAR